MVEHDTLSPSSTIFRKKIHVYLLKVKGKVFDKFKEYKTLVENQTGMKIKKIRSDNGGKFVS